MSHWGMEQPSFQPTYPSDCGERAKDTHNFLFFFFLVGGSWTTEVLAASEDVKAFGGWESFHDFGRSACMEGREAQPGNRGTWKNTVTVDTPSQHPFLSLEDGGAVESDCPQKCHSGSRGRFWIHSLIHQKASDWIGSPWFGGTETKAAAISTLTVRRQWKWMSTWAHGIVLNWTLYCLCQHCHQQ